MRGKLFFICTLLCIQTNAQYLQADSLMLAKSIESSQLQFQKSLNVLAPIYNGTSYIHYWNKVLGHPYFGQEQQQNASICFKEYTYIDVPLKFDLVKYQIVILNPSNGFEMALLSEHISGFNIASHEFIKLKNDSTQSDMPGPGFYELLYNGKSSVIAKYSKRIEASLKAEDNFSKFVEYAKFYIHVKGRYHLVENKSDIYRLLVDQKSQLRKYNNKENLQYSKSPAKTLTSIAAYYDSITNE
jgi:hypothetical protein